MISIGLVYKFVTDFKSILKSFVTAFMIYKFLAQFVLFNRRQAYWTIFWAWDIFYGSLVPFFFFLNYTQFLQRLPRPKRLICVAGDAQILILRWPEFELVMADTSAEGPLPPEAEWIGKRCCLGLELAYKPNLKTRICIDKNESEPIWTWYKYRKGLDLWY